jgi:hypothetical protein
VLVGPGTKVDIHAQVLSKELSCITVTHDDALQITFQESNHIDLKLLDQVAHAVLRRPHVVVE